MATTTTTIETVESASVTSPHSTTTPTSPTSPSTTHTHSFEIHALATLDHHSQAPPSAATAFPDGGLHAWLVVLGAFSILACTFGLMTSVGVLQSYWAQNQLAHYTDSQIGWIPSVFVFLSLLLGVQFGPLFDRYGPRWINLIASAGYVVCLVLLAECTEYWQFMLTLGVWGGVCCAALSTTGLAVLSHWFRMRRGLANGIAMAGTGLEVEYAVDCFGRAGLDCSRESTDQRAFASREEKWCDRPEMLKGLEIGVGCRGNIL
ncbi:MAG: hypothetical protein Q9157_002655 [Trypethelium eluteriae]